MSDEKRVLSQPPKKPEEKADKDMQIAIPGMFVGLSLFMIGAAVPKVAAVLLLLLLAALATCFIAIPAVVIGRQELGFFSTPSSSPEGPPIRDKNSDKQENTQGSELKVVMDN